MYGRWCIRSCPEHWRAAGQGIATPGNVLARLFVRRGLSFYAYNAYQSIIRGGHIFLTMRVSDGQLRNHGDSLDLLVCLNQDTMDRHLHLMRADTRVLFNSDTITPGDSVKGVRFCPYPVGELTQGNRNKLVQNTVALGVLMSVLGLDFDVLEQALALQFKRKGQDTVDENIAMARAGFNHAAGNFEPFAEAVPTGNKPLAVWTGNDALAMGAPPRV